MNHATTAPAQPTSTTKRPVTAQTASFVFYDIESLNNVFSLAAFNRQKNEVDVFFLVDKTGPLGEALAATPFDTATAGRRILESNPAYQASPTRPRTIRTHDLSTFAGNVALARMFGLSDAAKVNDPDSPSTYTSDLRPVCDTDKGYDPFDAHPYLAGYNSQSYDTTMLALYMMEAFQHLGTAISRGQDYHVGFIAPEASRLRAYNDALFTDEFKKYMPRFLTNGFVSGGRGWDSVPNKIRQAMMNSGRHIDVSNYNEAQNMVGLKRLLGGLGRQIMESDKLGAHNATVETLEDLYDLLAYNVSDVIGLAKLFEHPTYSSGFDLKKGLLDQYPETIYDRSRQTGKPNIHPKAVRRDRLTPDATSAKLVGLILSPYGHLKDMPGVSFMYPSEMVAKERGVERFDVLETCKDFFYEKVQDPHARAQFDQVYRYYRSIEGRNFNDSSEFYDAYPEAEVAAVLSEIPKSPNNLWYYRADGTPSTCFATFSTGGIHGAEANWALYALDLEEWERTEGVKELVKAEFPDPLEVRMAKEGVTLSTGRVVKFNEVLTSKTTLKGLKERSEALTMAGPNAPIEQIEAIELQFEGMGYKPLKDRPEMFKLQADGSTKLKPRYTFTSMAAAIHEDFTSYYPNMLRNMSAFYNEALGEDRYAMILADKDRYGREMKAPGLSADEKTRLSVLRSGTKLVLNSASGAGDMATGRSPIRVNNTIISMRIIGQLFSWLIGQAQTLAGANIISTNTDGLYSVLDEETNNRVLAEMQTLINVEIEPEPLVIVSKDSNNRLELEAPKDESEPAWEAKVVSASGGTLACHHEPLPTKRLSHPSVIDWALARYLRYAAGGYVPAWRTTPITLDEKLDRKLGKQLLMEAANGSDAVLAARRFQNVIAASAGMITFPFAADPVDPVNPDPDVVTNARPLQHYNRMFVVHAGKPGAVSLRNAGAWKVSALSRAKRQKDGTASVLTDKVALQILQANGFARDRLEARQSTRTLLPEDQDVAVSKITGVDPSWSVLIENGDLVCMPEAKLRDLLGCLDLDAYVGMLATTFENNWSNTGAGESATAEV